MRIKRCHSLCCWFWRINIESADINSYVCSKAYSAAYFQRFEHVMTSTLGKAESLITTLDSTLLIVIQGKDTGSGKLVVFRKSRFYVPTLFRRDCSRSIARVSRASTTDSVQPTACLTFSTFTLQLGLETVQKE